jgi:cell division protein FtsW (lipid II flippase)
MNDAGANPSSMTNPEAGVPPVMTPSSRAPVWRWVWLVVALLLIMALALLFLFNPAEHAFYPFCFFQRMTGFQCPGCGGLRATHQLLHGHIATAFQYNPLVVMAAPFVLFFVACRWWRRPGRPMSALAAVGWTWVALGVLLVFWIVRNLPLELFRLPGG